MTAQLKKTLLIGLAIFAVIILTIGIVYFARKPTKVVISPTPKPVVASPVASATSAPIFVVDQISACTKTFTVACASSTPSATPSATPSISPSPSAPVYASPSPSTPTSASLDCVAKRAYMDDDRNRAGFYYLEQEIVDTNTLQNGQIITYNVVAKNAGSNSAPDTTITDKLSENLTYIDGDTSCAYDSASRVVTCTIGTLAANSEAQRSFRAKVQVSGTTSIANSAEVLSTNGQRDSCSIQIDATGKVTTVPSEAPVALPVAGIFEVTAGTLGIGIVLLIIGGLGLLLI